MLGPIPHLGAGGPVCARSLGQCALSERVRPRESSLARSPRRFSQAGLSSKTGDAVSKESRRPDSSPEPRRLRSGQQLGKYKLGRKIGEGGFAVVYRARDVIEACDVALKIPFAQQGQDLDALLREVRINTRLEHPNILRIRNATTTPDGRLLIAYPLGLQSLDDRLRHRIAGTTALEIMLQVLDAAAYAHRQRVIHCDINPRNIILFEGPQAMLTDFGIAKISRKTRALDGSGTGTVGYIAPEQAMGAPSFRSDVFSLGLLMYRLFAGKVPRWPFRPPHPNLARLRRKLSPDALAIVLRAIHVDERKRFRNATQMHRALEQIAVRALR